ncbi:type II secretion system F family protein [Cellulomonas edaphi]|uniref:Type II secretion system F family protein n=1 Tax=Cellulomonas edaphi TaxID=3053468 RepID=A0ABT7S9J2_9CELL|nr:type II secretion system F family protein [Cellulomons edaphi]MDM7832288.1 type II secretion system F family protein [Cellulomons edaphi]
MILLAVLVGVLAWAGMPPRRPPVAPARRDTGPRPSATLSSVLLVTAAQLRAGATPERAWSRALGVRTTGPDGMPSLADLAGAERGRAPDPVVDRAAAVLVAAGAARELGAPLADVLEQVAESVAADEEAAAELRAALAGPRATARVLGWLPVLGLVVATLLGARPWVAVLGGGLGTAAALLGVALLLVGRLWTRVLLARAGWGGAVGRGRELGRRAPSGRWGWAPSGRGRRGASGRGG